MPEPGSSLFFVACGMTRFAPSAKAYGPGIAMANHKVLSDRFKAAFKTALAMVLAYGVALSMDWDHAYWAGFAVAFCTLSTFGESLNRACCDYPGPF